MKKAYMLLALMFLFLLQIACKNDDDSTPVNPIDQLPPATQIGANTAGCLVDGKAIFPSGGNPRFQIFYLDGKTFGLLFRNEENNINRIINISSVNEPLIVGQKYILSEYNVIDPKYGEFILQNPNFSESHYQTNSTITGELIINYHNFDNAIISGEFWFDAIDGEGNIVKVREGRFDGEY